MSSATIPATFAAPHESRGEWSLAVRGDERSLPLHVERWYGEVEEDETAILERAFDAALDIGCGPGRHAAALHGRGIRALGLDVVPDAVAEARSRGARAVVRSIFDPLPGAGRWGSAILLDGNIGIGGDPGSLLRRTRALVRPRGRVLVEAEPPGVATESMEVRLERDGVASGSWFPWATVGVDGLAPIAERAGLVVDEVLVSGGRWFASLEAR